MAVRQYREDHDLGGLIRRHWTQYLIYLLLLCVVIIMQVQNRKLVEDVQEQAQRNTEAVALIQRINMERRAEACEVRASNKAALTALVNASFEEDRQGGTFTLIINGEPAQVEVPQQDGRRNQARDRLLAVVAKIPQC